MSNTIRLADQNDADAVTAIYAPVVESTAISFEIDPPTSADMGGRIAETLEKFPWLVCQHGEEVVGYAYASQHQSRVAYQWSVNVSVYIHPAFRRFGVGRALYHSLFNILRLQGFYHAFAGVTLPNPGSVGLHESLGFQPLGVYRTVGYKFGAWHDVGWWQLGLRQLDTPSSPPSHLSVVKMSAHWNSALTSGLTLLKL